MYRSILLLVIAASRLVGDDPKPADVIIHNGRIVTVDAKFNIVEAIALKGERIIDLGTNQQMMRHRTAETKLLDAKGKMILPGLHDSHVHPNGAAFSEGTEPLPEWKSLKDVFGFIKEKVKTIPKGEWIVIRYAFPTRLDEARFPTKAELDEIAPDHPVLYHAGPAGIVNSCGLAISGVTKDTKDPPNGMIVKDSKTGEPTGMLRNAYGVLKGLPKESSNLTKNEKLSLVKKQLRIYNEFGLTSIADRNANREDLDLYYSLKDQDELTIRVNVARSFNPYGTKEEIKNRLNTLPGADKRGGPTNVGDEWIRIGPIKLFLDGGMLNGTAYMRQPWPKGPTYQVTEDDYRGLLFIPPEQLKLVVEEAARLGWQVTAHTAGESAMDHLLDAYEFVNRLVPIKDKRFCITHANFPSKRNLERCKDLGVCADVQPAWLYKDGTTLLNVLGKDRVRWFQPYKSWLEYTTIGGGSDHMLRFDSLRSTNPWNPWLGIAITLQRTTERGTELFPEERLSREQAIRLYTINNAYLHREEKEKGSLEPGKLADLIMIDRDILKCTAKEIPETKVLWTMIGGKMIFEKK